MDVVDRFVESTSKTSGTDRLLKTISYAAKLLGYGIRQSGVGVGAGADLEKIATQLSMSRYPLRFSGAIEAYQALQKDTWALDDDTVHIKKMISWQAYSMLLYYPLEHISWIGWTAPRLFKISDANKYSEQSCVMWTIYLVLDVYINLTRIRILMKKEKVLEDEKVNKIEKLKWTLIRDILYLPNALHWSIRGGILPDPIVQLFGFLEAIIGLWRSSKDR